MSAVLGPDCFVSSLALLAYCQLGPEALDWDPLMVRDAMEDILGDGEMPQLMFDKLNCGLTLLGTTTYTDTIEGFLTCTSVMNGNPLDAEAAPYCSLSDCAWGIWEYINLSGDLTDDGKPSETFCPEIVEYIRGVARSNGVYTLPNWMSFAMPVAPMPDMADDPDVMGAFMQRQDAVVADMNAYVTGRMSELARELNRLKGSGKLGAV